MSHHHFGYILFLRILSTSLHSKKGILQRQGYQDVGITKDHFRWFLPQRALILWAIGHILEEDCCLDVENRNSRGFYSSEWKNGEVCELSPRIFWGGFIRRYVNNFKSSRNEVDWHSHGIWPWQGMGIEVKVEKKVLPYLLQKYRWPSQVRVKPFFLRPDLPITCLKCYNFWAADFWEVKRNRENSETWDNCW